MDGWTKVTEPTFDEQLVEIRKSGHPPSTLFEEMPPLEAELVEARAPSAGIPSPAAPPSAGGK